MHFLQLDTGVMNDCFCAFNHTETKLWNAILLLICCCVRVLRPTNSLGHTETGPRFKVSSERLTFNMECIWY